MILVCSRITKGSEFCVLTHCDIFHLRCSELCATGICYVAVNCEVETLLFIFQVWQVCQFPLLGAVRSD